MATSVRGEAMADECTRGWARRLPLLIGGAALAVFAALIAIGARGVRGSDQYWYLSDLVMLKAGRGMTSNVVTPILWASDTGYTAENLPPPVHHVPVTYLAAGINAVVDNPYIAWVLCNALLAVVAALLLYVVARALVQPVTAAVVAALFLVSPQTVWFTLNPLMEQSLVLAAVVLGLGAVWLFTRPMLGTLVMAAAVAFMAVSRASNVVLIPSGIALLCVLAWRKRTSWWLAGVFGAAATSLWLAVGALLPQYPIFSVKAMLAIRTSADLGYGSNLGFYTHDVDVTPEIVANKALTGLTQAFLPSSAQELLLETGVIVLLVVGVVWGARSGAGKVLAWWAVSLFAAYLATSALMQPQTRYLAPVLPLALALGGKAYEVLAARISAPAAVRRLGASLLGLGVAVASVGVTLQYAAAAEQEAREVAALGEALGGPGSGSLLVLDTFATELGDAPDAFETLAAPYVLAPSLLVYAEGTEPSRCVPADAIERWGITRVTAPAGWSDERVRAAFCPAGGSEAMSFQPAGDGLAQSGRRLLSVEPG